MFLDDLAIATDRPNASLDLEGLSGAEDVFAAAYELHTPCREREARPATSSLFRAGKEQIAEAVAREDKLIPWRKEARLMNQIAVAQKERRSSHSMQAASPDLDLVNSVPILTSKDESSCAEETREASPFVELDTKDSGPRGSLIIVPDSENVLHCTLEASSSDLALKPK